MAITLSVVGIFFGATIPLEGDQPVLDVLNAASQMASNGQIPNCESFTFLPTGGTNVGISSFTAYYTAPFEGRAVGRHYADGEYFLPENLTSLPAITVWQYYTANPDGTRYSNGSVVYLNDPQAIVPTGGRLTWRLCSILAGPNPMPKVIASRQMGSEPRMNLARSSRL